MDKKKSFASFAKAGVNIMAKLKKSSNDIIIPQNITYTENEGVKESEKVDKNIRSVVENISRKAEEAKNDDFLEITEETAEAAEKHAEEAFSQFQNISTKLENIKKSLLEVITNSENKRIELLGSGLKKEDLQKELDKTAAEIDEKLNIIREIMDKTGEVIANYDTEAKSTYTEISENLKAFSENVEKTEQRIETIEGSLNEAKQKVGEIHQTTSSIDKLYDSVFELKTANKENKEAIEKLVGSSKKQFKLSIITACIVGLASIASVVMNIVILLQVL